jgi:hypothetical protein
MPSGRAAGPLTPGDVKVARRERFKALEENVDEHLNN